MPMLPSAGVMTDRARARSVRCELANVIDRPMVSMILGSASGDPAPGRVSNARLTSLASTGPSPSAAMARIGRLSSTPPSTCSRRPTRRGGAMPGIRTDNETASAISPRRCTTSSAASRSTLTVNIEQRCSSIRAVSNTLARVASARVPRSREWRGHV